MSDQFSDDLKQAIEEGFVVIDERTQTALVGANIASLPDTAEGILLLMRKISGLRAELSIRHGYTVL
jgi:hypothetical protein